MVVTPYPMLLGVGAGELVVVVLVFLLLFGVDRIPQIARTLGRLQGEWAKTRREVERELRSEEERAADERRAFERARDRQVRESLPEVQEERRLRAAAEALGVDAQGKSLEELRAAVAAAASGGTEPGP